MSEIFSVPILFLIFNRPSTTQQVFDQIKIIKPAKLYISADGPRNHVDSDKGLCEETRRIIEQIDWDCELHTRFLDENLGCAKAISSGITWFFSWESEGIILEDDCLPHQDFFPYCEYLLEKYRDNPKVMMIAGGNSVSDKYILPNMYDFSRWAWIWGWASWKRAWKEYDITLGWWKSCSHKIVHDSYFDAVPLFREEVLYVGDYLSTTTTPDTWDYQWAFTVYMKNGLCIVPQENLISNIGAVGVHYSEDDSHPELFRETKSLDLQHLCDSVSVTPNQELDNSIMSGVSEKTPQYLCALKLGRIGRMLHIFPLFQRFHPLRVGFFVKQTIKDLRVRGV